MIQHLSHATALELAHRGGGMFHQLHGRPDLVIGIARGGTALSRAFAAGSAARCSMVVCRRRTTRGLVVRLRESSWVPRWPRQLYKRLLFPVLTRIARLRSAPAALEDRDLQRLRRVLDRERHELVVIVDDAVDSGRTARSVLSAVQRLVPGLEAVLFTLTSTVNTRVTDRQLNVFTGILDYQEGDIAQLRGGPPSGWTPPLATGPGPAAPARRSLYLDLDGTLVRDSFAAARSALYRVLFASGRWDAVLRLGACSMLRKSRLISHLTLKKRLDRLVRSLPDAEAARFQACLAGLLVRESRATLVSLARAHGVHGRVVTAALASCKPAIEQALGIPVLAASGPGPDGTWMEVDSVAKRHTIEADRAAVDVSVARAPALWVGDTLMDALALPEGVTTTILPPWDRTGMMTLLGASSWWRGPVADETVRAEPRTRSPGPFSRPDPLSLAG